MCHVPVEGRGAEMGIADCGATGVGDLRVVDDVSVPLVSWDGPSMSLEMRGVGGETCGRYFAREGGARFGGSITAIWGRS